MSDRLDLNVCRTGWLSLGLHVDHRHWNIVLYLPFLVIAIGWMAQPRSGWSPWGIWRPEASE